jgi:GNAT superfamily N-acetyltransferase
VRGVDACAWSVHADVANDIAGAVEKLAQMEPVVKDFRQPPAYEHEYRRLLTAHLSSHHETSVEPLEQSGPAMTFPVELPAVSDIVCIEDERLLAIEFRNWTIGEIAGGRAPVLAICEGGLPVSVCFCARSSSGFAEAGIETTPRYRGRGLAPRVTAAWAQAIRAQGRTPLYSTQWTNAASLTVARKLGLIEYACTWSLAEPRPG